MNTLTYTAPDGTTVTFDDDNPDGPFRLNEGIEGLLSALNEPVGRGSPGQVGVTARSTSVGARRVIVPIDIFTADMADLWDARATLAAVLWSEPVRLGEYPPLGTLTLSRTDLDDVEIPCLPVESPSEEQISSTGVGSATIEFWMPDPRWRATTDEEAVLAEDGGFTFPISFPFSPASFGVQTTVTNPGTVASPIIAVLDGPFTNVRLTNLTTDETIAVDGVVLAGEQLRLDTGFGRKTVTHIDSDGVETSWMGRLNLDDHTSFWQIARGDNLIAFDADSAGVGSTVTITYRAMYAGV